MFPVGVLKRRGVGVLFSCSWSCRRCLRVRGVPREKEGWSVEGVGWLDAGCRLGVAAGCDDVKVAELYLYFFAGRLLVVESQVYASLKMAVEDAV